MPSYYYSNKKYDISFTKGTYTKVLTMDCYFSTASRDFFTSMLQNGYTITKSVELKKNYE